MSGSEKPVTVSPQDPECENSPIEAALLTCVWNNVSYSTGATICVKEAGGIGAKEYLCTANGTWRLMGACWPD